MRLLLLAAATMIAAPALANGPTVKPLCQDAKNRLVQQRGHTRGIHPLSQEPPANQTLTVLREQDGCTRPVDIRRDLGHARRGG